MSRNPAHPSLRTLQPVRQHLGPRLVAPTVVSVTVYLFDNYGPRVGLLRTQPCPALAGPVVPGQASVQGDLSGRFPRSDLSRMGTRLQVGRPSGLAARARPQDMG